MIRLKNELASRFLLAAYRIISLSLLLYFSKWNSKVSLPINSQNHRSLGRNGPTLSNKEMLREAEQIGTQIF